MKQIEQTKLNVEKKQAMNYATLEAERGEEIRQFDGENFIDAEEGQKKIFNPPKSPMRMAYWLYKLQGVGQEFKCEIYMWELQLQGAESF